MTNDTRGSERLNSAIVVAVKSSWGDSEVEYHVSKNLSRHGVYILDDDPPEANADLKMEFSLPQHGIHLTRFGEIVYGWVEGTVIRVDDKGYAVKLEEEYGISLPV